ncbi:hypothetical protein NC651_030346 [Populus alba x Populus x berolinensis]|nr:hypothetical protein NC651_030346 [Populus alba x Populus x berolinensis]
MSDGAVHVVEPSDVEMKWGGPSSQDNGTLPSNTSNPSPSGHLSELPSRCSLELDEDGWLFVDGWDISLGVIGIIVFMILEE